MKSVKLKKNRIYFDKFDPAFDDIFLATDDDFGERRSFGTLTKLWAQRSTLISLLNLSVRLRGMDNQSINAMHLMPQQH
ncbi:hypothetical protein O9929_17110 [Vibrio lentus]|nr:hypothetical protein [Vibrio lentus]